MDDVAISIVCTDNHLVLEGCLHALPAACDGLSWRATVVDNASTDGTSTMVREQYPWATLIQNERRHGFAYNHNLTIVPVIERGDARYVLVLNDDTRFDPRAVTTMVREMDELPDLGALGPQIRGVDGSPQQSLFQFPSAGHLLLHAFRPGLPSGPPGTTGWLNGSCLLLRREAIEQVGSLDDSFFIFFEDTDLGYRLLQAGWRSAVSSSAGMVHLEHQTVKSPALGSVMAKQMLRSQRLYVLRRNGRLAAEGLAIGTRLALLLRCAKALVRYVSGDGASRTLAQDLFELARYQPTQPLPHESA